MNLKTKVLGFVAGSALALGLASGTFAAGETSVTLIDGNACTTGTVTGAPINFGTYTWNGTGYATGAAGTGSITVPVSNAVYAVTQCNVTVSVSDLDDVTGSDVISKSQVTLSGGGIVYTAATGTGLVTIPQNTSATISASLSLAGVTNVAPDTFTGTITAGPASAS